MSVLFGEWNFDGKPVDPELVSSADAMLTPYAPDALSHYEGDGIVLDYHAIHTTTESRRERQPFVSASGAVLTWDGRLDNREELIGELRNTLSTEATDVEVVAAAFDRWGIECFAKILGDWALAIWDSRQRQLILAKDFCGIRPLYYFVESGHVRWSSVIEPLVILADKKFKLNEEYAAGWLAMYPAPDQTPYVGIQAVPPCSFVVLNTDTARVVKYWDFDPSKRITYGTDAEYEEHFHSAFRQAIRRRLRADRAICCELSGGMDSPSITCMADLIRRSAPEFPQLYTLSFYNDGEPHADERPYFVKVEEKLGRVGCHIDTSDGRVFEFDKSHFVALPGNISGPSNGFALRYTSFLQSHQIRVVLSGIGGDEVTGGVPSPVCELQDLLVRGDLRGLAHKLKLWALAKRKPWFHLAAQAIGGFLPTALVSQPKFLRPGTWLQRDFVRRHCDALSGFNHRVTLTGPLPTLQANLDALEAVRRQLATIGLSSGYPYEKRYPFLDRTLLEFIFAVPREQILQPGYRRSLLRRALRDIVPAEILDRRRKAYASRAPRVAIIDEWENLSELCRNMLSAHYGIVDEAALVKELLACRNDDQSPFISLMRTIVLEAWLRNVCGRGLIHSTRATSKYITRERAQEYRPLTDVTPADSYLRLFHGRTKKNFEPLLRERR